jgi:type IV pilus assembly protein PilV
MPGQPRVSGNRQSGAGLIEVAIALLLLAIGTLGLGRLQIAANRIGYEAMQRSQAAVLAADLLERLRANRRALGEYATAGVGEGSGAQLALPPVDCGAGACSAAELRRWDMWQWEQALDGAATGGRAGGLVRPTACVMVSGRKVTVEVAWQGFRALSSPPPGGHCGVGNYGPDDADQQWLRMSSWIGED